MLRIVMTLCVVLFSSSVLYGDMIPSTSITLKDEGAVQGQVKTLDCVGTAVTCSRSGTIGTVTVTGGSGTPAGATGEVQFNNAGAFGANSNLFWDNTAKRIGIGTSSPASAIEVKSVRSYGDVGVTGQESLIATHGNADEYPSVGAFAYGGVLDYETSALLMYRARGTRASPSSTLSGDYISYLVARGYNSALAGYSSVFEITGHQSGAATAAGNPGAMSISTNDGTTQYGTERFRIDSSGNVGLGTSAPNTILDVNGAYTQRGMAAPSVSPVGQGRLYFDSTANQFKVSENAGAYRPLGGNIVEVSVDLGTSGGLIFSTTITGQTWVTAASSIACTPLGVTTDGQTVETVAASGVQATISDRVAATGFNLNVYSPHGATGTYRFGCTGA